MITKLYQEDNSQVMPYLMEEKALNLFIIGDIENFGYNSEFQDIWADFDDENNIKGILLRYYHSYVVYSKGNFDVKGFVDIIQGDRDFEIISGKKEVLEKFCGIMEFGKKKELYFAEVTDDELLDNNINLENIKKAIVDDVEALCDLSESIEEFDTTPSSRKSFKKTIETGTGRTYFAEKDGRVSACASTTAENSASAMVVGVCTHPKYRQQGLATKCITALCNDMLKEGRTLCLFYDNPAAGRIYKRLGFKDIGMWSMYSAKRY